MNDIGPLPLYVEIRRSLEAAILTGAWPAGHRVPSELELTARYGCSRMTVNKALSALAAAGLIVRRRRFGSFVAVRPMQEAVLEIHNIQTEIMAGGHAYRHDILGRRRRPAKPDDARRLGVEPGAEVLAVSTLHFSDELPLVLEDRLIALATVPDAAHERFVETPPGSWLLARIPWTEAEHRIRSVGASPVTARHLKIAPGAACLVVERRTWQGGAPVTAVELVYPGDRHHLVGRFRPLR